MCENKTIVVKTNNICKMFIMIYMLKQLIDVKSNNIFVLQTAGKGTSCPACVWQTDLHTGTAAVCEPALSLLHTTAAIYLYVVTRSIPREQVNTLIYTLQLAFKVNKEHG